MTRYMRHMGCLFEALPLEDDKANRRRLDAALRRVLGSAEGDHCPEVWALYRALSDDECAALVPQVRVALED